MRRLTLISLLAVSVPLAACGSSSSSSTNPGASSNYQRALAFASCMRSHGVPNFPDPKANGNGGMQVQVSPGGTRVNGVSVNGPAFQSAMQACRSYEPSGGAEGPASPARRRLALEFAQCMRAHGVPNFPDPTFHGNGIQELFRAGGGLDPNSPTFKSAQKACGPLIGKASGP